jgi:GAF domain-containing protein/CheY-like chemotaxis protein
LAAEQPRKVPTRQARLETLLEVSRELSQIQPLESLLTKIAEACGRLLGSDSAGIRIREGDDLVLAGAYGDAREAMPTPRLKMGESLSGTVAATGKPLVIRDAASDPRMTPVHRDAYRRGSYKAFLGVPLILGTQVLGVLSIRTRRTQGFSAEDLAVATAFAAQAAVALENAHLYRRAAERAEKLKTFSALTRLITSALDSRHVAEAVAEASTTLLGAASTRIWVADPTTRVLHNYEGFGLDSRIEAVVTDLAEVAYGQGLVGRVAESRAPEYISDITHDARALNHHRATEAGLRGFAGLPLVVGDGIVGVLAIMFREPRQFTPDEKELMGLLADHAAISIHNARLLQESTTHQGRLEALLDVSHEVSKLQPVESLLGTIAEACGHLLRAESVGFRLVEGDELVVSGTWGDAHEIMLRPRLKLGESLSGRVAVNGETLLVADLATDPRLLPAHREASARLGYRSVLAVPVKIGARVMGVLNIQTKRAGGFSAEDVTIATAFASQAAVALENSRLYQETQRTCEELSATQDQLTQARKMEAVGRLAGGVAHDFNNLLTIMIGRSHMLLRRLGPQDPSRQEIELLQQTAGRAADLTRQLLAFSRKQVLQPRVLDLNAVVSHMGTMLRRLVGEDIALVTALDPAVGRVKVDPSQVQQIIMNLIANARDAMPWGGRLTIETADADLDAAYARRHVGVLPGPYVMLAVSDTGVGMDPETQARVFEPFFTTKGPGQGTGLGLATVYGVVKQSGGHIWVYSEPGQGTTFKIYLPRVEETVEPATGGTGLAEPAQGHETVLVVEDEGAVRELTRDLLRANGYTVLEARHGREALRIGEQHPGPIHLMLTDVVMPEMSGRELAEKLVPFRPAMAVIYMSGYTDTAVVHHGVLDPGTVFLQKPFTPDALARKVRQVLDPEGGRAPAPFAGHPRGTQYQD